MKNTVYFDVLRNEDITEKALESQKQIILNSECSDLQKKQRAVEDLEILNKIAQCKYAISDTLKTESIFDIVAFLESNYYDQDQLLGRINNLLRFLFIPPYYKDMEEYELVIPQEFWITPLGKLVVSCLSANDDILLSAMEAAPIVGYKRQNMNVLVRDGKIPAKKVGGNLIFRLLDVLTYKKKNSKDSSNK